MGADSELIDIKDRKILKSLFANARTSYSSIAKQVQVSKEVVNYRINRLLESGLLTGFNTVIDVKKLGYEIFFMFLRFRNLDSENEKKIISYLRDHPNVCWFVRCMGNYDCILKIIVEDYSQINEVSKEIEKSLGSHFDDITLDYVGEELAVPFSFVYGGAQQLHFITKPKQGLFELKPLHRQVLKEISNNARKSIADISKSTNQSRDVVKYNLSILEKEGIILNYRPDFWPDKLGYNWYYVILKNGKMSKELDYTLKTYLMNQENVTYIYQTIGQGDLQIEFRIKSTQELNTILMEIRGILKTVLKRIEFFMILKEYKYTYFPGCMR